MSNATAVSDLERAEHDGTYKVKKVSNFIDRGDGVLVRNKLSTFELEVAQGNVPGIKAIQILGLNPAVGTSFEDVWCPGGSLTYPTSAETWEIVSTSVNDSSTGTGARTVEITTLDANYVEQTPVTVTLNGTTPVAISGTHFRHVFSRVKTWGSTGENQGDIIIRVSGGGDARTCINYDTVSNVGFNNTQDSQYTVPAGKTFYPKAFFVNCTKDHDITARFKRRLFGEDGFLTPGNFGIYQNSFILNLATVLDGTNFPEKTDFKWIAKSNNTAVAVTTGIEGYLIDN